MALRKRVEVLSNIKLNKWPHARKPPSAGTVHFGDVRVLGHRKITDAISRKTYTTYSLGPVSSLCVWSKQGDQVTVTWHYGAETAASREQDNQNG